MHQDRILMTMMKRSLSGLLLLLLLTSTVSGLGSVVSRYYAYIQNHDTWQEAQDYCRSSYSDLAVIYTQSDADRLNLQAYHVWIGLHRTNDGSTNWIWSNGGSYNFSPWASEQPHDTVDCATAYYYHKKFYGENCERYHFFICHKLGGTRFKYTFVHQSKTWSEAQQYCRTEYNDLASFSGYRDLFEAMNQQDFPVWTGLHRDGETWKWSKGISDYRKWASDEPANNSDCVAISSISKNMIVQNCSTRFPFVCFKDNLVLVKENKTWEEALDHCRALTSSTQHSLRSDLVSVQLGDDNDYVMKKVVEANTEEVWAGLRFLAGYWLWVNGADMLYTDLPVCPPKWHHCGALSKNSSGGVVIRECSERRNFLCYTT